MVDVSTDVRRRRSLLGAVSGLSCHAGLRVAQENWERGLYGRGSAPEKRPRHGPESPVGPGPWVVVLFVFVVGSGFCTGGVALAQRPRPFQIGALTTSWGPTPSIAGLRDGLVALGYREDVQFVMGVRFTQGDLAALPAAARELVQAGVDVLIADSDNAAKAAQMATTRIPIVFMYVADPVGLGLVKSFAQPGGNLTGVTNLELELGPKRLEIFQEMVPGLKRVLFPYAAQHTSAAAAAQVNRDAARHLGMELVERPVHTEADIQAVLAQLRRGEVDGILVPLHSHAWNLPGRDHGGGLPAADPDHVR